MMSSVADRHLPVGPVGAAKGRAYISKQGLGLRPLLLLAARARKYDVMVNDDGMGFNTLMLML